ncbi:MAG TPA: hypothetical protein VL461_12990 [Dictyobacter sp.]|nr:hypothetical protein [Dictyobacter sp.]
MSTNPDERQQSGNADAYGGYRGNEGYRPQKPADDPYQSAQYGSTAGQQQNDPGYVYGGQQQQQQYSYGQGQQQQGAYVPPQSVSQGQAYVSAAARRAAFISYLGFCFTGIVLFFFGRKSRFVRFHAAQSVVVFTPLLTLSILVGILKALPIIGFLLGGPLGCIGTLISVVGGILWIFLMIQAYRGVMVRIPIVANFADGLIARFSRDKAV